MGLDKRTRARKKQEKEARKREQKRHERQVFEQQIRNETYEEIDNKKIFQGKEQNEGRLL